MAMIYAARHPERVSRLILYGAYARGQPAHNPSPQDIDEAETMLKLVELGWGQFGLPPGLPRCSSSTVGRSNTAGSWICSAHDGFATKRGASDAGA